MTLTSKELTVLHSGQEELQGVLSCVLAASTLSLLPEGPSAPWSAPVLTHGYKHPGFLKPTKSLPSLKILFLEMFIYPFCDLFLFCVHVCVCLGGIRTCCLLKTVSESLNLQFQAAATQYELVSSSREDILLRLSHIFQPPFILF